LTQDTTMNLTRQEIDLHATEYRHTHCARYSS